MKKIAMIRVKIYYDDKTNDCFTTSDIGKIPIEIMNRRSDAK